MDDALIIKYIRKKNEKGLELLIKKYGGLIKAIVNKHMGSLSSYHEECVDDVLIAIWDNIASFDGTGSFKSWIGVVAKFKAIDYKRKYFNLTNFEDIDNIELRDKSNFVDEILYKEFKEEVHSLLDNLKEKDKRLFIDYYLEEKKLEDISTEMSMSKEMIYNKLSRGRKKLKSILKGTY